MTESVDVVASAEQQEKHARVVALLRRRGLDALLLTRAPHIAWISGGARAYVDTATDRAIAALLLTPAGQVAVTDNIEAPRLRDEEPLSPWGLVVHPWYEAVDDVTTLTAGLLVGADAPVPRTLDVAADLREARAPLVPAEIERLRSLGRDVGAAMMLVARAVERGMTEHQVAGLMARAIYDVGAVPTIVQAAAGERAERYRHALPTDAVVDSTLQWAVCARRHGLIVSATRLLCFGPVPAALQEKLRCTAIVEATALAATRPGATLGEVFAHIQRGWTAVGYPEAWRQHHQGGPCSYDARDVIVTPDDAGLVRAPQAFAWNPSLPGAKSEDTVLVTESGPEFLTRTPGWPTIQIMVNGRSVIANGVLQR